MIAIVDYGAGNLSSLKAALAAVSSKKICITNDPSVVASSPFVVLPGVGSFSSAMREMNKRGLNQAILQAKERGGSLLGICLGMHLLFEIGMEGQKDGVPGLAFLKGTVEPLQKLVKSSDTNEFIPRVGWKEVFDSEKKCIGWAYFTHSFFADKTSSDFVCMTTKFGEDLIPAGVRYQNIFGLQFHPEKSSVFGLNLLSLFLEK